MNGLLRHLKIKTTENTKKEVFVPLKFVFVLFLTTLKALTVFFSGTRSGGIFAGSVRANAAAESSGQDRRAMDKTALAIEK